MRPLDVKPRIPRQNGQLTGQTRSQPPWSAGWFLFRRWLPGHHGDADRRLPITPVHALRAEHGGGAAQAGFVIAAALSKAAANASARRPGWLRAQAETKGLAIGCFGAGTRAAAAP
ncbi:hypothetical protein [Streptomyces sp. BE133]|uniref:hypothetical protein n=1 Tax=Streptomyces sp. BE133 TaxID=3002523 RepID=UPI002E77643D|nr:hypothetical protein [Streptomyces sp. BE133]MEE1812800.1 hypothetical protein [Streptomyces sp. BE133]